MFQRRGNKLYCQFHPDVEATQEPVKTKRGWKLGESCKACDSLVEELRKTKCTDERHLK